MEESSGANEGSVVIGYSRLPSSEFRPGAVSLLDGARALALSLDFGKTIALAQMRQQLADSPKIALDQPGLCVCGDQGRPFVTIHGTDVFLCLACFLREAREGRTPRATQSRLEREGRGER
jgi:hypothetical protein